MPKPKDCRCQEHLHTLSRASRGEERGFEFSIFQGWTRIEKFTLTNPGESLNMNDFGFASEEPQARNVNFTLYSSSSTGFGQTKTVKEGTTLQEVFREVHPDGDPTKFNFRVHGQADKPKASYVIQEGDSIVIMGAAPKSNEPLDAKFMFDDEWGTGFAAE